MTSLRVLTLAVIVTGLTAFSFTPRVGYLSFENDSSYIVTHIYVSPCDEDDWNGDLLGESEVVDYGEAVDFEVDPGCWDLKAVVENDYELAIYTINIDDGEQMEWTVYDN